MTAPLSFTQGSPEWERQRKLALTDLYWLCAFVLGWGERVPMREHAHRLLCRFAVLSPIMPAKNNDFPESCKAF